MRRNKIHLFILAVLIFSTILAGCNHQISHISDASEDYSSKLILHFIDVNQGDSTFIEFPNGETSLIDAGSRGAGDKVVSYLNNLGVKKIDYLIATHPHEDHIGGLPKVIRNFDISKVYMPDKTSNTLIFEELLKEIKNKHLKITLGKGKDIIMDEGKLKYSILAPNRNDYSITNDFSIVTKVDYMDNSIIITGDAEKNSERDILNENYNLKADILKVGHHGGSTSSIEEFLNEIKPEYSVISVGRDNSYGHPHSETLDRLNKIDTTIMRTDKLGDIVFISNGKEVTFIENTASENKNKAQYIGNKNTKVFHSLNCNSLPKEENQIIFQSIEEAKKNQYKPHKTCVE